MKKPKGRSGCSHRHEGPPTNASAQAERSACRRSLNQHAQTLQDEISSWQAVSSPRGNGNHRFMDEARNQEHQQRSGPNANQGVKRPKHKFVGKLAETQIPAFSPKLA